MTDEVFETVRSAAAVYGDGVALDDPAELFHEAAKAYPSFAARSSAGVRLLESSPELQQSASRAVKRHPHVPRVPLPMPAVPHVPFADVVARRRSVRAMKPRPLSLAQLSTLLFCAYGCTGDGGGRGPTLRTVPSGGALYPLELHCVVRAVEGLEPGLYHYDPLDACVERLRGADAVEQAGGAMIYGELYESAAVLVTVSAMVWRSRFKYGVRGFRFTLLEAGHVAQNLVLACAAERLAAVPLGGFFDARLDELLELDGVNEVALYAVCVGTPETP